MLNKPLKKDLGEKYVIIKNLLKLLEFIIYKLKKKKKLPIKEVN